MSDTPDDAVVCDDPIPLDEPGPDALAATEPKATAQPDSIMVSGIDINPGFATVTDENGTETRYPSLRFNFYGQDGDHKRWGVPPITLILAPDGMRQLARMFPQTVKAAIFAAHDGPTGGVEIRTVPPTNRTGARSRKRHRR